MQWKWHSECFIPVRKDGGTSKWGHIMYNTYFYIIFVFIFVHKSNIFGLFILSLGIVNSTRHSGVWNNYHHYTFLLKINHYFPGPIKIICDYDIRHATFRNTNHRLWYMELTGIMVAFVYYHNKKCKVLCSVAVTWKKVHERNWVCLLFTNPMDPNQIDIVDTV